MVDFFGPKGFIETYRKKREDTQWAMQGDEEVDEIQKFFDDFI